MTLTTGPRYPTAACRSCGAQIVWALTTANQRKMPVDAEPVAGGNVVLTSGPTARVLTASEVVVRELSGMPAHTSHFVTCAAPPPRRVQV